VWFDEFPAPVAAVGRFVLEPMWLLQYRHIPTMTVSLSSLGSLVRYGLKDLHLVPEGTDLPVPSVVSKEAHPTVCFVGRLVANKRPGHAIDAFAELRWRFPDAQLWIVGTGPLEERLRQAAPPGVTFWGRVSEQQKVDLLARAHVLVATSRREGWGLTVTEAASVGTPAVCYDIPGLRDSVRASGIGHLCPPSPAALAAALATVLGREPPGEVAPPSWDDAAARCLEVITAAVDAAPKRLTAR
jgi:glycosyltransferase involved in cell wall biosynthesis